MENFFKESPGATSAWKVGEVIYLAAYYKEALAESYRTGKKVEEIKNPNISKSEEKPNIEKKQK